MVLPVGVVVVVVIIVVDVVVIGVVVVDGGGICGDDGSGVVGVHQAVSRHISAYISFKLYSD